MGFLFDNNVFFFAAIDTSLVVLLTGVGGAAAMNAVFSSPLPRPSDNTDESVVLDVLLWLFKRRIHVVSSLVSCWMFFVIFANVFRPLSLLLLLLRLFWQWLS